MKVEYNSKRKEVGDKEGVLNTAYLLKIRPTTFLLVIQQALSLFFYFIFFWGERVGEGFIHVWGVDLKFFPEILR